MRSRFKIFKMPPNGEHQFSKRDEIYAERIEEKQNQLSTKLFQQPMKWNLLSKLLLFHVVTVYGLTYIHLFKFLTILWGVFTYLCVGFGITAGAHRLWSHRSFKAKLPLQIILLVCYSMAGMTTVYTFVKIHRIHHKFTDTDADPHNSKRGFWFSHLGWLLQERHPDVIDKQATIDMSDITNDPLLQFHRKHNAVFITLFSFVLPTILPIWLWSEYWWYAILSQVFIRFVICLNAAFTVNSFAHMWGYKPYNRNIRPTENPAIAFFSMGEGWHNYHHVFPWDYRASELGAQKLNLTTRILDLFRKIGWVYNVKIPSAELIKKTKEKYAEKNGISEVLVEFADTSENHFDDFSRYDEKFSDKQ